MGNLSSLVTLQLSHNALNGTIPASLAALPSLQTLDLSYNQYPAGALPAGLTNVTNINNQTAAVSSKPFFWHRSLHVNEALLISTTHLVQAVFWCPEPFV